MDGKKDDLVVLMRFKSFLLDAYKGFFFIYNFLNPLHITGATNTFLAVQSDPKNMLLDILYFI